MSLWQLFGKRISLVVDRWMPRRGTAKPSDPMCIQFDPAGISSRFTLGPWNWPFSWPDAPGPVPLKIVADGQGKLVLWVGERSFTFGVIQQRWGGAKPEYQFAPEADDVVSFTRQTGRLAWPTPFEISWLGGTTPKWKRMLYDRLKWAKSSGAVLEVMWLSEEWFYRKSGWADMCQNRLTRVAIRAGRAK